MIDIKPKVIEDAMAIRDKFPCSEHALELVYSLVSNVCTKETFNYTPFVFFALLYESFLNKPLNFSPIYVQVRFMEDSHGNQSKITACSMKNNLQQHR